MKYTRNWRQLSKRVRDPPTSEALGDFCGPVTINVLPANEYQPDILPKSQTVQIQENLPEDKFVATFNCSDKDKEPDGNPAGCSSIYIESGDDPLPKFKIVNNNTIYTTNNVIDYDNGDVMYTLIVVGVDSSTLDPQKTGSMTVTVHIEPVNEFTPFIDGQQLSINIPETTQIGTEILPVTATDNDTDIHGELTYKITGSASFIYGDTLICCKYI
ncbi:protocadherin gamma-B7-like [Saccostrea echinata]|uniref:protocadherin gamma-B7-like n=1 Tax=Saccostrea echinata TaxID=191078 RepID=UPI002A82C729|nr:protocadherin gamma-B7-like [Saccostrea echinata]